MTRFVAAFRNYRFSRPPASKGAEADASRSQDSHHTIINLQTLVAMLLFFGVVAFVLTHLSALSPLRPLVLGPVSSTAQGAFIAPPDAPAVELPFTPGAPPSAPVPPVVVAVAAPPPPPSVLVSVAAPPAALPSVLAQPAVIAAAAAPAAAAVPDDDAPAVPFTSFSSCLDEMRVEQSKWTCPTTGADWKAYNTKPETLAMIAAAGGETPTMRTFMGVYEGENWGCGSGHGSSIDLAARTICNLASMLPALLNVTLLVDFPCGDQQWAPHLRARLPHHIKYLGVDATPGVVQRNRELFSRPGSVEFLLAELAGDSVFDKIKAGSSLWQPGDRVAVLSRHVLEHNTYAVDAQYIRALRVSGAEYYIGTSIFGVENSAAGNILGGASAIDFHAAPWNWRRGLVTWFETSMDYDAGGTLMEVWQVKTLPEPTGIV